MDDYPSATTYLDDIDCFILIDGRYYASNDKMIREMPTLDLSYEQFLNDNGYSFAVIDNECVIVPEEIGVEDVTFPSYSYSTAGNIYLFEEEAHTEPIPDFETYEAACKIRDEVVEKVAKIREEKFDELVDEVAEECRVHLGDDDACFISKFYTEIKYPRPYNFSDLSLRLYLTHKIIVTKVIYHGGWGIAILNLSKIEDKPVFSMKLEEELPIGKVTGSGNHNITKLINEINENYGLDIESINLCH